MKKGKPKDIEESRKNMLSELKKLEEELVSAKNDLEAFLDGKTPPSVAEWQKKIVSNWNDYNFIASCGHVYKLTDEVKKKPNGAFYSPCDLCELSDQCVDKDNAPLCAVCGAEGNEYFYDAGELDIMKNKTMKITPWF